MLVVHSMDRLARSLVDLLASVRDLTGSGVAMEFFKEKLVFDGNDSPSSKLMLAVMGGAAEFGRDSRSHAIESASSATLKIRPSIAPVSASSNARGTSR